MESNITIAPNIYVRSSTSLQSDDEFIKKVCGYKALNILKTRFPKSYSTRLSKTQLEEMKQSVICRLGKTREYAFGKALSPKGNTVWSCRCENKACHNYERCMSLPNALRIERDRIYPNKNSSDKTETENPMVLDTLYGFEDIPIDETFEAPHVVTILPILAGILDPDSVPDNVFNKDFEKETVEVTENVKDEIPTDKSSTSVIGDDNPPETVNATKALNVENSAKAEAAFSMKYTIYPDAAEKCTFENDGRVLVVCASECEAKYFSTILYKNEVKHCFFSQDEYTLSRKIADVFWDYCGDEIEKDAFFDRCIVRVPEFEGDENEIERFYNALFRLCGDNGIGGEGGICVSKLADSLNGSPELISECILNMGDDSCLVTLTTLDELSGDGYNNNYNGDGYDEIMILEGAKTPLIYTKVVELFDVFPAVIKKESLDNWIFDKSALGRPCRFSIDNFKGTTGQRCLNVCLGLWGDIDGKSFLAEQMGDSIRLQLYIAERINEGDELVVEKNTDNGGYWLFHEGNILGEFSNSVIREVRAIEGFPDDFVGFEGIYVKNIVTCVSKKDDNSIPERFRNSRVWLGIDITGYAKIIT